MMAKHVAPGPGPALPRRRAAWLALTLCAACSSAPESTSTGSSTLPEPPAAPSAQSQPAPGPGVTVTYLGNEGVLLADQHKQVIIDGLYGDGLRGYPVLGQPHRQKLESAQPPFDAIDLILATHIHDDHFSAAAVAAHLQSNPRAHFLSTQQAVEALHQHVGQATHDLQTRISALAPGPGQQAQREIAGVSVRALHLTHGADVPVQNLGFIVTLGGLHMLHVGDTVATVGDFQAYQLDQGAPGSVIDIAFIPYWHLLGDDWEEKRQAISARHLVAIHFPAHDAPARYFQPAKSADELVALVRDKQPGLVVFEDFLRSRSF